MASASSVRPAYETGMPAEMTRDDPGRATAPAAIALMEQATPVAMTSVLALFLGPHVGCV
jgi:hypothetical protein